MINLFILALSTFINCFNVISNPVLFKCISNDQEVVVATINGEPLHLSELQYHFNRNPVNDSEGSISEQLREFLPAYVFYKLKLLEGLEAGFDRDEDLLSEHREFAREAAYSYWLENPIKDDMINTFKKRLLEERKAFHILAEVHSGATAQEDSAAFARIMEARKQLLSGADPEDVNLKFSTQRNGTPMGGSLPWITAGRTVPEFEDGLFALDTGEISMPVRSQFGYHIIYLEEIRNRSPERLVSHIFFHPADDDSIMILAENAYKALAAGEDWNEVSAQYSMDSATASRGGTVGWVGYGMQFPEPFVDAVMQIPADEPYSKPIGMEYGYHIIRIDSVMTFVNDDQFNEYAMNQLQRLQRISPVREDVYSYLKELGNLKVHENIKNEILSQNEINMSLLHEIHDEAILTYFDEDIPVTQLIKFLESHGQTELNNETIVEEFITEIVRESLIHSTYHYHPEYMASMTEFLHGLIVFKVNEEFIWNPDLMEREKLKQFYLENIDRYRYGALFTYYRYSSVSDSVIAEAHAVLTEGTDPLMIEMRFPDLQVLQDSTRNPNTNAHSILKNLNPGDISAIQTSGSLKYFYYLVGLEEPRSMTFNEAFYRIAGDYQPVREEDYLKELMNKYQVELYPDNI